MIKIKKVCFLLFSLLMVQGCSNYAGAINNGTNDMGETVHANTLDLDLPSLSQQLNPNSKVISEFTTQFIKDKARTKNITLASLAIDQVVIEPNAEFSYNQTVGPTTKRNGFLLSKIFINGKESNGYGGGVCQVSSTLYNAVLGASLLVTERHPHSKEVTYVGKDLDAATSYGVKDFKFINNRPYPIKINSYITDDKITIAIETL